MSKTAVVYWSGTGNTQQMAAAVARAVDAQLFTSDDFKAEMLKDFDAVAFGCPSMGAEELEDSSFEPMFEGCKPHLSGKRLALFGSYDWGDGEWMRTWQEVCEGLGAVMVKDGLICNLEPEEEDLAACEALGQALAQA